MKSINVTTKILPDASILIDDEDYEFLAQFHWYIMHTGRMFYAYRSEWRGGKNIKYYLHREIMKPEKGVFVDHVNSNGLDCRRENLRLCTRQQNAYNMRKRKGTACKYKGVSFHPKVSRYSASIKHHGKERHLGYFATQEEAASAYNQAAQLQFGAFARLNTIG